MYSIDNCTALWYSITKCTALLDYTSVVQLSVQRAHCFCTHFCTVQLNAMFWHCFCTDVLHCCNGRALLHCCLCHCCWSLLCRVCDLNQSWAVAVLSPNIGHISMKRELGGGGGGRPGGTKAATPPTPLPTSTQPPHHFDHKIRKTVPSPSPPLSPVGRSKRDREQEREIDKRKKEREREREVLLSRRIRKSPRGDW